MGRIFNLNDKRKQLYYEYCVELLQYAPESYSVSKKDSDSVADYYIEGNYHWIDILSEEDLVCGFLIYGEDLTDVHGDGRYICEAFIQPAYRRIGIMRNTVAECVQTERKTVYLEVFDRNNTAKQFWLNTMKSLEYANTRIKMSESGIPGLVEYEYRPKEAEIIITRNSLQGREKLKNR